ncbi:hypothetical protein [Methylomonas sp. ZR1]|uniref:hypothetical protein n=1 Tax=Methylomonas sp. ZR1 TaxID=1797072 RepID=UPI0014914B2A|nr:hypothetical protein [Methylomonas sp. ZR1]NOV30254.1 hypothetical protein [Methylomonas sp. ZR1]
MKNHPFLISVTSAFTLLSALTVLAFVFPKATADISSHLHGEEAVILYIAFFLIFMAGVFYFKKNQDNIERLFSGRQTTEFVYRRDITTYLMAGFICAGASSELVTQDKALHDKIVMVSGVFLLLNIIAVIYRRFWPSTKPFL